MKNNNFVKTILALAAILIVFSISVSVFAETGKNTSGEFSEVTTREGSAEADDKKSDTAVETDDADTAAEENEENAAESKAEKPAKHHKGRKPAAPESGSETESNPEEGLSRDKNRRPDKQNKEESNAEYGKEGSFKKHSFGKDSDDDDEDDDDDEKEYGSKDRFGHSKRNSSRQQSDCSEVPSDKKQERDHDRQHRFSSKRSFPSDPEQENDNGLTEIQDESGNGTDESSEAQEGETQQDEV